jgi:hypothetical protein
MGDYDDDRQPSELRSRIARTRATYQRESNPTPLIVGSAFILVVGVMIYFIGGFHTAPTPAHRANRAPARLLKAPAKPNYGPASGRPAYKPSDETQVYNLTDAAKKQARNGDVAGALAKLNAAVGKWPRYDAELYFAMAICVGEKERSLQSQPQALQQMWQEKAGYYQQSLDKIGQGGKFAYGKQQVRLSNLNTVLQTARQKAGM